VKRRYKRSIFFAHQRLGDVYERDRGTDALNPNVASTGWRTVNSWLCGSAGML
jgi:hypothetical protein